MRGEISLRCFQDLQNGKPFLDRSENVVICGNYRVPFTVRKVNFLFKKTMFKTQKMGPKLIFEIETPGKIIFLSLKRL